MWTFVSSSNRQHGLRPPGGGLEVAAVVVEAEPVLRGVGLHQVQLGVEEDAPPRVNAGHPDREVRGLEPG